MKGLNVGKELVNNCIEAGPVKIDNPIVEGAIAAAVIVGGLYTLYKVVNNKQAAQNIATACGKRSDKD